MFLDGNIAKNFKKGPKTLKKNLQKPRDFSKNSSAKIFFDDSEAFQSEISCHSVKN